MPKNAFKMSADHHQIDIHARVAWSGDKQLCRPGDVCPQKTPSRSPLRFGCWIRRAMMTAFFIAAVDSGTQAQAARSQPLCGRILLSSGEFVA